MAKNPEPKLDPAYLRQVPVLKIACEQLGPDLIRFLAAVRDIKDKSMPESLWWYLFEEIGWPEGAGYLYGVEHIVPALRKHYVGVADNACRRLTQISDRLPLRLSYWRRPTPASFVEAHEKLKNILESCAVPTT